jgi:hypothetical protein
MPAWMQVFVRELPLKDRQTPSGSQTPPNRSKARSATRVRLPKPIEVN